MVRRNSVRLTFLAALIALVLGGCSSAATYAPDPTPTVIEPAATAEMVAATEPGVVVDDQDAGSGVVTVKQVDSAGSGWMVIHATTAEGGPGAILGYTHVEAGTTPDVKVDIELTKATDQLFAMLHVDAGVIGTFEFPDGADVPALAGDQIVNVPFLVTLPVVEMAPATLELNESGLGQILTDGHGFSLYLFSPDNQAESSCYDSCAQNWPPYTVDAEPTVGEGLEAGLLGTVERTDGKLQLTYAGWPLYFFAQDVEAGDVNGQGVSDVWFLVTADGSALIGGDDLPDY